MPKDLHNPGRDLPPPPPYIDGRVESSKSAVAWPAIIGGAFVAAAASLALLLLGSSLGLASVSPWSHTGASLTTISVSAIIWLVIMQWASAGLGGYVTGRLRTKFVNLHTDEVFFRDTAHGLLTWSVATVITAGFLASATSAVVSGGVHAASAVAGGAAMGAAANAKNTTDDGNGYYIDSLFRSDRPNANASSQDVRAEAARIFANDLKNGNFPDNDKAYLTKVVASRTGLSQADASARVDQTIDDVKDAEAKAKKAADDARKVASRFSLFTFLSMLVGAFVACVASAIGGIKRDEY